MMSGLPPARLHGDRRTVGRQAILGRSARGRRTVVVRFWWGKAWLAPVRVSRSAPSVSSEVTGKFGPAAGERRRIHVVAGAYRIPAKCCGPDAHHRGYGALLPEALAAAERLTALGESVDVVCVTNPGLLVTATQARLAAAGARAGFLDAVFPAERAAPLPTGLDGHPTRWPSWPGLTGCRHAISESRRSASQANLGDVYRHHQLDTDGIIAAGLDLLG